MSLNWEQLIRQGRARAIGVAWTPEELEALLRLETERGLQRTVAADFIRNGIVTLEDYDKAVQAEFKPKTVAEAQADAHAALAASGQAAIAGVELAPTDAAPVPAEAQADAPANDAPPVPVAKPKGKKKSAKKTV